MFPKTSQILLDQGPLYNPVKPEIPGLAPRPPPPSPLAKPKPADSDHPTPATCLNCAPLQKTLELAFEQLRAAQTRVKAALVVGKEAVERSNERVGGYDALYHINRDHGMPFQDGDRLPKDYLKKHPRHELNDPSHRQGDRDAQKDTKVEKGKARENPPQPHHGRPTAPQAGRGLRHDPHPQESTTLGNESDESEESIPPGHSVSDSEAGEDGDLLDIYNRESEKDDNWELDPDAEGESDNE